MRVVIPGCFEIKRLAFSTLRQRNAEGCIGTGAPSHALPALGYCVPIALTQKLVSKSKSFGQRRDMRCIPLYNITFKRLWKNSDVSKVECALEKGRNITAA
jgi:hypothetical protein